MGVSLKQLDRSLTELGHISFSVGVVCVRACAILRPCEWRGAKRRDIGGRRTVVGWRTTPTVRHPNCGPGIREPQPEVPPKESSPHIRSLCTRGVLAAKVGYFGVKSAKVYRVQMGTNPAKVGRLGPRCAKVRRGLHPAPTGASPQLKVFDPRREQSC